MTERHTREDGLTEDGEEETMYGKKARMWMSLPALLMQIYLVNLTLEFPDVQP